VQILRFLDIEADVEWINVVIEYFRQSVLMTRKYLYIIISVLSLLVFTKKHAKGQEFPWTLQYISNMHTINPAFVGMWDQAGFMLSTRKDYTTIKGANLYQQLSYHTPIKDKESGIGLNVINRNVGLEKQLFFTGDYSYQIRLDMYYYLRFGLRVGFVNYSNNLTDYQLYPDGVPDSQFLTDLRMQFMTVVGFGGIIFNDDYYVSLSIPQFINNTFQVNHSGYSSVQEFKTVYLSTGYLFHLPMSLLLRPNLLIVGTVNKPVYFDAAAILYLPNNLQFGINMRSNGSSCFSAQYTFSNNMRIGFAADYAFFQDIQKFQLGTYEVLVGFDFNVYRKKNARPNYF